MKIVKVILVDDQHNRVGQIECDLESIILEAEQNKGDVICSSILLMEEHIGYKITESSKQTIENYIRKFMAMGEFKTPLIVQIKNERRNKLKPDRVTSGFEEVIAFPNKQYEERYNRLVGLEALKMQIQKEATILLAPEQLKKWSLEHHGIELSALRTFQDRYPFMIFEGDVGTGKTEFAETFGASIAASIKKKVILARMSMKSRGSGVVGEMSKLISQAFLEAKEISRTNNAPVILLLDEADSLAQSREEMQMHHEDRAGVNALIQGIDHIRDTSDPILVVFCTNRSQALDPAIKRRASVIYTFTRPNLQQRIYIFDKYFTELNLDSEQKMELAKLSGEKEERNYGFTYSDLITRVIPQAVFTAFPKSKVSFEIIKHVISQLSPTPPFKEQ